MRTNLTCLLIVLIAGLSACGKDDKDPMPELTKLTKVTCYSSKLSTPLYEANILYTTNGEVSRIDITEPEGSYTENFIYDQQRTISLYSSVTGGIHTVHTLSGNRIIQTDLKAENDHIIYDNNTYYYTYEGVYLTTTSWVTRYPDGNGGYVQTNREDIERYSWERQNLVSFKQPPSLTMEYQYSQWMQPANFPQRFQGSFDPTGFETLSPLNFSFGYLNQYLPERAWSYDVSNVTQKLAEYTFHYTLDNGYVTKMIIEEENRETQESNVYTYTFSY